METGETGETGLERQRRSWWWSDQTSPGLTKHSLCMARGQFLGSDKGNEWGIMPINIWCGGGRWEAPGAWWRCWRRGWCWTPGAPSDWTTHYAVLELWASTNRSCRPSMPPLTFHTQLMLSAGPVRTCAELTPRAHTMTEWELSCESCDISQPEWLLVQAGAGRHPPSQPVWLRALPGGPLWGGGAGVRGVQGRGGRGGRLG